MVPTVPRAKLENLQYLRALAALLVLVFHAEQAAFPGLTIPTQLFHFGQAGVDLFFVISGFIIYHVHAADLGRPDRVHNYFRKRFFRIYPLYWIVTLAVLLAALFLPGVVGPEKMHAGPVIESLLLLPMGLLPGLPLLPVGWSLFHEMMFYLLFGLAILLPGRFSRPLFFVWLAFALLWNLPTTGLFPIVENWPFFKLLLSPFTFQFAAGVGLAWLWKKSSVRSAKAGFALLFLGLILFSLNPSVKNHFSESGQIVPFLYLALACGLLLWGALKCPEFSWTWLKPFRVIGDASYSIYLVHFPVIALLAKVFPGAGLIIYAMGGLLSGLCVYFVLEQPLLGMLRGRNVAS